MKSRKNDKAAENDGLTKESYETFWDNIKENLDSSINKAKIEQSISQRQAIIKLIEKKDLLKDIFKTGGLFTIEC